MTKKRLSASLDEKKIFAPNFFPAAPLATHMLPEKTKKKSEIYIIETFMLCVVCKTSLFVVHVKSISKKHKKRKNY